MTFKVRLGDVAPDGRLRLDAIARYLQDVATDDATDDSLTWVVRKVAVRIESWPRLYESLEPTRTWCSGVGQRWAERSTTLAGGRISAAALWVNVDPATFLPARLPHDFFERWGAAAEGRKVSGRLTHPDPPGDGSVAWRHWALRATDYDVLDHVNNAAYWEAAEEVMGAFRHRPSEAEIEYRQPVNIGQSVSLGVADGGRSLWLRGDDGTVFASMVLR